MDRESPGRALWLEERRRGLGGTDAAAILGVSKWASAYDVWLEKTGQAPAKPETPLMWWGRELEELIARRYMERTGLQVWKPDTSMAHPEYPHIIGSPDRLVIGQRRGLEIKNVSHWTAHEWGEQGTDDIPGAYLVQCQHYMLVTGHRLWDVAALIGGSEDRLYQVRADDEFLEHLLATLNEWWARHIVGGEPPPIDGGRGATEWVAARFPREFRPRLAAGPGEEGLAERLKRARSAVETWEEEKRAVENALKVAIGEAEGLDGSGWRITWKLAKGRTVTDWEKVARALEPLLDTNDDAFARAVAEATEQRPGSRRFLFTER